MRYTLQIISTSPSRFRDPSHEELLVQKVPSLLQMGEKEEVPQNLRGKGFCSCCFLTPEANGSLRPILDLYQLNSYLKEKVLYGQPGIQHSLSGDWYTALDLRDAYCHVSVYHGHTKFFRFVAKHSHFQLVVLPFSFPAAP